MATWAHSGAIMGLLGGILDAVLSELGQYCAILEAILKHPGRYWSPHRSNASQRCPRKANILQSHFCVSQRFVDPRGGPNDGCLSRVPKIACWSPLGASLGRSWALLVPSWGIIGLLGALLGHRGNILRPRGLIGREWARRPTPLMLAFWGAPWEFPRLLGPVFEWYWGLLEHVGNHLDRSWSILGHLGDHLGLPDAHLEPS